MYKVLEEAMKKYKMSDPKINFGGNVYLEEAMSGSGEV